MESKASRISRKPPSARERTYRLLRKKLLTGSYAPNQRLTEESIARELGVSRTPVREALHKLDLEGLVEPAGARGFRVPEDSVDEMNELFAIRAVMEGHALACLTEIVTDEHIRSLHRFIEDAEKARLSGHLDDVFQYNTRFHDLLYSLLAHQKPRLYNMIEDMRDYVVRYRKNTLVNLKGVQRSIAGHKKIVMALSLGDPQLCEHVMRKHVHEAREDTDLSSRGDSCI